MPDQRLNSAFPALIHLLGSASVIKKMSPGIMQGIAECGVMLAEDILQAGPCEYSEDIRQWAVRLLAEAGTLGHADLLQHFAEMPEIDQVTQGIVEQSIIRIRRRLQP